MNILIFQEKGMLGLIFLNQTVNWSKNDDKRQTKANFFAIVQLCSQLKTGYISRVHLKEVPGLPKGGILKLYY